MAETPCACGSLLRAARCCQAEAAPPSLLHAEPLIARSREALARGDRAIALALVLDVLDQAPTRIDALRILHDIRRADGAARAAETLLRRVVHLDPNSIWGREELSMLLLRRGLLAEAEHHARMAIRIAPEKAQAHNLMGMILTEAHRPRPGEHHLQRAIALSGGRPAITLANLAWNLKNQGRMQESRALYRESVQAETPVVQTLIGWSRMEEADRAFDAAGDVLDRAERAFPDHPSVLLARAVLQGRMRDWHGALATLDRVAAQKRGGQLGPEELAEKGRLLDALGDYDQAFAAFAQAKQQVRDATGQSYLGDEAERIIRQLTGFFRKGRLRLLPRATVRTDIAQPVFILGFPRSGTTLIEQMLSAHPAIAAGDELPLVGDIATIMPRLLGSPMPYPEALTELWMGDHCEDLDTLRDYYLHRVRQLGVLDDAAAWFTDKMPLNETHLGLIALMFPAAPLVHVIRHPLDVVLSVFSNHLTHGFRCAFALESAAVHYVRIMDLVDHYVREMQPNLLRVRYEDVVDAPEDAVRRLLAFIGAPFDPRCLDFHHNRRYARTASYAQVSEPLYDRSRYRYRNYLQHLAPVVPILRPVIERLGYTI